ncbi:MAG: hypothetical protein L0Z70_15055 [Chloroflexi bacterium]|nr:hypothetical protein [Chloroflexota bacterium]
MKNRGNIATAIVLIGLGVWFLALEIYPPLKALAYDKNIWPLPIIAAGGLLALAGLLTWTPALMTPAAIVSGIGGILYWQNATGNWESWAYIWALIPGFVGVGVVLGGVMQRNWKEVGSGVWTMFVSLVLLAIFGSFLGGLAFGRYWPVLLILLGVVLMARGLFKRS